MSQHLLAAEVDQIQDFIFRAAHLREVVGGSQILTLFEKRAEGMPATLGIPDDALVVSSGGSFRVSFDDEKRAKEVGAQLAEAYHRLTQGSLSVTKPIKFKDDYDFSRASSEAQEALREAKRRQIGSLTTAHLPYIAFCVSCGVGLAIEHKKRHQREQRGQYLCDTCLKKGEVRAQERVGAFLKPFMETVIRDYEHLNLNAIIWPGGAKGRTGDEEDFDPTGDLAQYDPRKYVAYLIADGNSMGRLFDQCSKKEMRVLSEKLKAAMTDSLATTVKQLKDSQKRDIKENFIPFLPLILGGDDIFALMPAPWALDFASQFCQTFEEQMKNVVQELKLTPPQKVTMAASVVICKANYPFYLAYDIGHQRLEKVKEVTKRMAASRLGNGEMYSAVDFEVILGSQAGAKSEDQKFRPTLRPYWITETVHDGYGLPLSTLLAQRYNLRAVPMKRLAQIKALYAPSNLPTDSRDSLKSWRAQRDALRQRITTRNKEMGEKIDTAFEILGGSDFYQSKRKADDGWRGHGLPDLLTAWDFAYKLDKPRQHYEEV